MGNGLIPLLPIYAAHLGANSAIAGIYLAIVYVALALGALSAGWVSSKLRRHRSPLIILGLICIPIWGLTGYASTVLELTVLTAINWFIGGQGLALLTILTGLSAGEKERGKIFGILSLSSGLGSLVGGLAIGWLVIHWGYTVMFNVITVFVTLWPAVAFLFLEEKEIKPSSLETAPDQKLPGLGKSFYLIFTACLLSAITGFFVMMIRSVLMNNLGFDPLEISSTGAIGGLIAMPFPFLIGWLSDRIGRKIAVSTGYLIGITAVALLAFSTALWHFWVVIALSSIALGSNVIMNAWVTDLVPREVVGKGLAIIGSAAYFGGVIGFAGAGMALQNLGFLPTLIIGGGLTAVALGLLSLVPARPGKIEQPQTALT